jgi:hypothetical protein
MIDLIQKYKNWTEKQNRKYYDDYTEYFQPHFRWNAFDTRNDWQPEILREYMYGLMGVGYAWECWSYWMRDKEYYYELPNAFWLELNGNR